MRLAAWVLEPEVRDIALAVAGPRPTAACYDRASPRISHEARVNHLCNLRHAVRRADRVDSRKPVGGARGHGRGRGDRRGGHDDCRGAHAAGRTDALDAVRAPAPAGGSGPRGVAHADGQRPAAERPGPRRARQHLLRRPAVQQAVPWYEAALKLTPNDVDLSTDLGVCYYYTNQIDRAITQLNASLAINPTHVKTLFNLGIVRAFGKEDLRRRHRSLAEGGVDRAAERRGQEGAADSGRSQGAPEHGRGRGCRAGSGRRMIELIEPLLDVLFLLVVLRFVWQLIRSVRSNAGSRPGGAPARCRASATAARSCAPVRHLHRRSARRAPRLRRRPVTSAECRDAYAAGSSAGTTSAIARYDRSEERGLSAHVVEFLASSR